MNFPKRRAVGPLMIREYELYPLELNRTILTNGGGSSYLFVGDWAINESPTGKIGKISSG